MKLKQGDIWMIERLTGRVHVGDSYRQAITYFVSRLKGKRKGFLALPKGTRKQVMRLVIRAHRRNRDEYASVMSGRGATRWYGR